MSRGVASPGEPWHLMLTSVNKLIGRLRQLKPFPIEYDVMMATMLPMEALRKGKGNDSILWKNLFCAMNTGHIVHVEMEAQDPSLAFWLKFEEEVPVAMDMGHLYQVSLNNPYYEEVSQWIQDAYHVHDELTLTSDKLAMFLKSAKHPQWVDKHWPALLPYVGKHSRTLMNHVDPEPKADTIYTVIPRVREEIEEVLTKCSLLHDMEINAWVAYADIGTGGIMP